MSDPLQPSLGKISGVATVDFVTCEIDASPVEQIGYEAIDTFGFQKANSIRTCRGRGFEWSKGTVSVK